MTHPLGERLFDLDAGAAEPTAEERAHLAGCGDCRAALVAERELSCRITGALPQVEPPADFAARVCRAFAQAVALRRARLHAWMMLGAAVGAAALCAGGVLVLTSFAASVTVALGLLVKDVILAVHVAMVVGSTLPTLPAVAFALSAAGVCTAAAMLAQVGRRVRAPLLVK